MEEHPEFQRSQKALTMDDLRHIATRQQMTIWNEKFYTMEDVIIDVHINLSKIMGFFLVLP